MTELALIYGGDTSEHDISVLSGKNCASLIDMTRYRVHEVELRGSDWKVVACDGESLPGIQVNKDDFSYVMPDGIRIKFEKVFMMIHGAPGENGLFQAYLEMLHIPCTSCSSLSCALTFDKYASKQYLLGTGVHLPKDVFIQKGDFIDPEAIIGELGLPLFVKPTDNGSSFGVTKVKNVGALNKAIRDAFGEGSSILAEEYICGRELTQGVIAYRGEIIPLPVTEIRTDHEFFDYDAKYLGESDEICPAEISDEEFDALSRQSRIIYDRFACKGMIRVDYMMRGNIPYFIEVNSIPGMTKMSLVPKQLSVAGIDATAFFTDMIENA
ncbi:MAG: ATP-grasp domain-containing protein [Bacteroidales bacterium]|jgi:D-alanine-D-alanine ligase|nr:ATP-grasp domain-containing protein [Bacteroidales bacterium]MCI2121860.1 ATP-grasp domain-containing protein [Bacteroidales bacterium]MCI2145117.1 ATP-grasp domain-containing protein [Bacteroidales bacterium]